MHEKLTEFLMPFFFFQKQREFHRFVHSTNAHNIQCWISSKLRPGHATRQSWMDGRRDYHHPGRALAGLESAVRAWNSTQIYLAKNIYILFALLWKAVTDSQWKKDRQLFHPQAHSVNGHNGWRWAGPKPGPRSFFQISLIHGCVDPRTWTILCCLCSPLAGNWITSRIARTWTSTQRGCWNCKEAYYAILCTWPWMWAS